MLDNKMSVAGECLRTAKQTSYKLFKFTFVWLIAPAVLSVLHLAGLINVAVLYAGLGILTIIYVIFPIVFRCSSVLRKGFIFMNFLVFPGVKILKAPEKVNLKGIRNFYITSPSQFSKKTISLGVWHILPSAFKEILEEPSTGDEKEDVFNSLLQRDKPIMLYAHGNSNTRACSHRIVLYEVFQKLDYHTIAFDYRGYGDSTSAKISENALVEDLISVYKWILDKTANMKKRPPIFVWGHSLGTGISTHALAKMASVGSSSDGAAALELPTGLILESAFNNFHDELQNHFLCIFISWAPWYKWFIVDSVIEDGTTFESDKHIANVKSHVLILHSRNDIVVPFRLGVKLYQAAKSKLYEKHGDNLVVQFEQFKSTKLKAHVHVAFSKRLPEIVSEFVDSSINKTFQGPSKPGVLLRKRE